MRRTSSTSWSAPPSACVSISVTPWGGWWFEAPLQGDPRVYAALPSFSKAAYMVKAHTKEEIQVLYGIGAPRCSNKPGGPEQILVAYRDYHPTKRNVMELV